MSSLPLKVLAAALAATFAFALPADAAKARKHKRVAAAPNTVQTSTGVRTCFLRGPLFQRRLPRRRSRPEYPVPNSGAILAAALVAQCDRLVRRWSDATSGMSAIGTYRTIQWRPPLSAIGEQRTTGGFWREVICRF
jgi:hypothetical protein